jgi:hypothetical protein
MNAASAGTVHQEFTGNRRDIRSVKVVGWTGRT